MLGDVYSSLPFKGSQQAAIRLFNMKDLTETSLHSERLFDGIVFNVDRIDVRLADRTESRRDIVRHAGGVGVLARTPRGTFLLVRQYRKAVEEHVLEIVAGMREPGEDAAVTGRRELTEETGYTAISMTSLGRSYASPGYTDEIVHLFFAETSEDSGDPRLDHDERLELVEMSEAEVQAAVDAGGIVDSKTLVAWYRYRAMAVEARHAD